MSPRLEFCAAMESIWKESHENAELVHNAPHSTPLARLDETRAARKPKLRWTPPEK